jgi:mannobiose 2-epimerase
VVDRERGGYLLDPAEKQLATQSRMIWAFSHAHRTGFGDYLDHAERGVVFLFEHFRDARHGGFFWKTDRAGRVVSDRKILCGEFFAVYALVEYYLASGEESALHEARALVDLLARRAHDDEHGGWIEHFRRSWRPLFRHRRGLEVEIPGLKSANIQMHALEALAAFYRQTADERAGALLRETIDVCKTQFFPDDPRACTQHRTRTWQAAGRPGVSVGHNTEFAWLLVDAETLLLRVPSWARFDRYLDDAIEAPWTERVWWEQAEILTALATGLASPSNDRHEQALVELLGFVLAHAIDPADGIWFECVAADGTLLSATKRATWKDAYHEVRATVALSGAVGGTVD